ncbi:sodium/potassium/calcium exchanger 4 [Condylostylus longicornis]|uniref:sodium/potassium/calcium exchanger 4 n=1 Tax=Condylostylus longicornis TaxID=2530218 RepID=UPI00244DCEFE|nr:sodium/potassium/calcium exchanger 4 [Condylostylus longicornis]
MWNCSRNTKNILFIILLGLKISLTVNALDESDTKLLNQSNTTVLNVHNLRDNWPADFIRAGEEEDDDPLAEFPKDLFTEEQRKQGAIILHLLCAIYFFTLLGIVCNDYFLPCVENITNDLHISKDVAAATFMATATSMPEFFTNTISTFITESDMGVGNIIGSLMFNTLGVAALSGLAIKKSVQLDWWPVIRDCIFYSFNTIVLVIVSWDYVITLTETSVMVGLLVLYYVVMFTNKPIMKRTRVLIEDKFNCCNSTRYDFTVPPERSSKAKLPMGKTGREEPHHHNIFIISQKSFHLNNELKAPNDVETDSDDKNEPSSLFKIPNGIFAKMWFFYSWPLKFILRIIVPDPVKNRKWYPLTFIICIIFIGIISYMVVWMLTVFGVTLSVPDIVMGLTFVSAGSTMPEAMSSLLSIRQGESGIGVSNSLGANSLAILLSLGVPWFIHNLLHRNDDNYYGIEIGSQGIQYTFGILLLSTASLFIILSVSGFRLRRTVGFSLISVYLVLIVVQILIEMKVIPT